MAVEKLAKADTQQRFGERIMTIWFCKVLRLDQLIGHNETVSVAPELKARTHAAACRKQSSTFYRNDQIKLRRTN